MFRVVLFFAVLAMATALILCTQGDAWSASKSASFQVSCIVPDTLQLNAPLSAPLQRGSSLTSTEETLTVDGVKIRRITLTS